MERKFLSPLHSSHGSFCRRARKTTSYVRSTCYLFIPRLLSVLTYKTAITKNQKILKKNEKEKNWKKKIEKWGIEKRIEIVKRLCFEKNNDVPLFEYSEMEGIYKTAKISTKQFWNLWCDNIDAIWRFPDILKRIEIMWKSLRG